MGTTFSPNAVGAALFGKVRRVVLGLLFCNSDRAFYLREVIRSAGVGQGAVQRELAKLTRAGLLTRRREGRQVYYQANRQSPVFEEIRSLLVKSAGLADVLRASLARLADRILTAFVFGSFAKGAEKAESDVDVMVVGEVTFAAVADAFGSAQEVLGREVNPSVYSAAEFQRKAAAGRHFVTAILRGPKVFLIGGPLELERLAGKRVAR